MRITPYYVAYECDVIIQELLEFPIDGLSNSKEAKTRARKPWCHESIVGKDGHKRAGVSE